MASNKKKIGIAAGASAGAAAAAALGYKLVKGRSTDAGTDDTPSPAGQAFLDHLAEAIRFETVSYEDRSRIDESAFAGFRDFLEATYPATHAALTSELVADHSLLFTWEGTDPDAEPILLMAHQDVVPVEPGTEGDWPHPPFSGDTADGFVWGRGALDDKGSLIGILEAVESLVSTGFQPVPTVYLAFGHDEEIGGTQGATSIAALLAERGVRLRFVLDEGGAVVSGFVPGVDGSMALVGVGEKGFLNVELITRGTGGHSSAPPPSTAIGALAAAIAKLEASPLPSRMEVQNDLLKAIGSAVGGVQGWLLRKPDTFAEAIQKRLSAVPQMDALIRTSAAVTMISGGSKPNLLPQEAKAIVNYRILPGDTVDSVLDHVRSVVGDDVTVQVAEGDFTSEPSPLSSTDSAGFSEIAETITAVFPDVPVTSWVLMGATDSRHFGAIAQDVYRFAPFRFTIGDLGRIHGTGERIQVSDADGVITFYRQLIERAAGG